MADAPASRPTGWPIAAARFDDLGPLAEMMAASPLLQRYHVSRDDALASLEDAYRQGDLILACSRSDTASPAGLAWVTRARILGGGAYLRLLLVAETRQGSGVGGRLLRAAETSARERDNHLYLLVSADNARARAFYERHGYRHVGDLPEHVLPGVDEALYHKVLRPHGQRLPTYRASRGRRRTEDGAC
ncbi:MAG: GNAT family N-acetyltransferase [Chloroflexi bacterium]|nr:GNAT family N-acetyltransferase [Chloroflexota bacterium]